MLLPYPFLIPFPMLSMLSLYALSLCPLSLSLCPSPMLFPMLFPMLSLSLCAVRGKDGVQLLGFRADGSLADNTVDLSSRSVLTERSARRGLS